MQELTAVMFVYFVEIEGAYLHTVLFSRYKKKNVRVCCFGFKDFSNTFWWLNAL